MAGTDKDAESDTKPLIVITGANGNIGSSLCSALAENYRVVGLDRSADGADDIEIVEIDITSPQSLKLALEKIGKEHGRSIAAVIHLVAFFDFSGKPSPLYQKVNV